jgi:hypothetical protein
VTGRLCLSRGASLSAGGPGSLLQESRAFRTNQHSSDNTANTVKKK